MQCGVKHILRSLTTKGQHFEIESNIDRKCYCCHPEAINTQCCNKQVLTLVPPKKMHCYNLHYGMDLWTLTLTLQKIGEEMYITCYLAVRNVVFCIVQVLRCILVHFVIKESIFVYHVLRLM